MEALVWEVSKRAAVVELTLVEWTVVGHGGDGIPLDRFECESDTRMHLVASTGTFSERM